MKRTRRAAAPAAAPDVIEDTAPQLSEDLGRNMEQAIATIDGAGLDGGLRGAATPPRPMKAGKARTHTRGKTRQKS